jgi:hypothetical protein
MVTAPIPDDVRPPAEEMHLERMTKSSAESFPLAGGSEKVDAWSYDQTTFGKLPASKR